MKPPAWEGTFADRIRRRGQFVLPPWFDSHDSVTDVLLQTFDAIDRAQVIVANNVSEYLYAGTTQERWTKDDFPCVAPPHDLLFIEWGRPSRVVSEVFGEVNPRDCSTFHTGILLSAQPRRDEQPGWLLTGTILLEVDAADFMASMFPVKHTIWTGVYVQWLLDSMGAIEVASPAGTFFPAGYPDEKKHVLETWATSISSNAHVALLTLTFANCKNVPQLRVDPPAKRARRDKRLGHPPRVSYNVIDIGPIKYMLRHEGKLGSENDLAQALHVCRGHFKTYTEDAPLFGRHTGTWWWAAQARGIEDAGVVEKHYEAHT